MDFPLFPWDRKRPRQHTPQAQNTLEWQGVTYGLRARNGLLFLRAAGESKTFVVATPLTETQEDDAASFPVIAREALESGDIARFVVGYDSYLERTLPLFFRAENTGFCRESWNRDDLPFEYHDYSVSMHEWMEGGDELLAAHTDEIGRQHLHGQLSALNDHKRRELEWICGSLEELEKLARWICHLEKEVWRESDNLTLDVRSENEFGRATVQGWDTKLKNGKLAGWRADVDEISDQLEVWSESSLLPSVRFFQLFALALDENTPTGLGWEYHDYGAGRCANEPEPEYFYIEVARPTAHEIVEAGCNLRDWLQGKMTRCEIDALLANDTPAELPLQEW